MVRIIIKYLVYKLNSEYFKKWFYMREEKISISVKIHLNSSYRYNYSHSSSNKMANIEGTRKIHLFRESLVQQGGQKVKI